MSVGLAKVGNIDHHDYVQTTQQLPAQVSERLRVHADLPSPAQRRALREAAGLSQRELAKAIGVSQASIAHWEASRRVPRGKCLERYVAGLRALRQCA
jgi:DNA-binding transcriptional regulator YiaG